MSVRSACAQLLLVVLVAALFALPRAAQAHQGHDHAMHAQAMHAQSKHAHAMPPPATTATIVLVTGQSLTAVAFSVPQQTRDGQCGDPGCCAHGSCTACCSMMAPMVPLIRPPMLHAVIDDIPCVSHSGIDGPSLRRPPRTFA